jgi:hypothetical protein
VLLSLGDVVLDKHHSTKDLEPFSRFQRAILSKFRFNAPKEVTWSAKFEKNAPIEMNNEVKPYDVWKVTATYPAGNKMIVTLDAKTGDILALGEIESGR